MRPLLLAALLAGGVDAPPSAAWSPEEAAALAAKLGDLDRARRAGRLAGRPTVVVGEGELNAYLNLTLARELPPGVSGVEVRFERERVAVRGLVDLQQVHRLAPGGALSPLAVLVGRVPFEVRGRLPNKDGFATLKIEDARVATVPLSTATLAQFVSSVTRSADDPDGFDIEAPFRLPYAVQRVKIEASRLVLEF